MQIIMTYQIVKLHKKVTVDENEITKKQKQRAILKLVMAELCEGLVPLAFAVSFAMAFYGPNAELLGYPGSVYWHERVIEDVSRPFLVISVLFLMDIVSLAFNSGVLWILCKVNLFNEFCSVMQKYWYIVAVMMVNDIWWHFYANDVNFGNDNTGEFRWIKSNKNFTLA